MFLTGGGEGAEEKGKAKEVKEKKKDGKGTCLLSQKITVCHIVCAL